MNALPRLYAIADAAFGDPARLAASLIAGGARLIQIRDKGASPRELFDEVEQITASAPADVRLIVNDRVDIARVTGAAGAHVGQRDLPPAAARLVLGPDGIVGFSTHNVEQALEGDNCGAGFLALREDPGEHA